MIARLLGGKLAHRQEHAEGVACKHNVARLPVNRAWYMRIRNELDQVQAAHVLRNAHIVITRCPWSDYRQRDIQKLFSKRL
jgi:hypothetical protein